MGENLILATCVLDSTASALFFGVGGGYILCIL